MNQQQAESVKDLAKPVVEVLEKLGWTWKPQVGEWFLSAKLGLYLVCKVGDCFLKIANSNGEIEDTGMSDSFFPILPWEEIERVLEGVGGSIEFFRVTTACHCSITMRLSKFIDEKTARYLEFKGKGKSRQEAVMKGTKKPSRLKY